MSRAPSPSGRRPDELAPVQEAPGCRPVVLLLFNTAIRWSGSGEALQPDVDDWEGPAAGLPICAIWRPTTRSHRTDLENIELLSDEAYHAPISGSSQPATGLFPCADSSAVEASEWLGQSGEGRVDASQTA